MATYDPTTPGLEGLWWSTFDGNRAYSPEEAKAYFSNPANSLNFSRGLINQGYTEGDATKIPEFLSKFGFDPGLSSQLQQNVAQLNSRQHNESSGLDLGMLATFAGLTMGLGGFGGLGSLFTDPSSAMAALEGTGGMWGAAPTAVSGSIGSAGMSNINDLVSRLNYGNPEWSNLAPQVGSNLTGGATTMANGAGTADWWDFGTGDTSSFNINDILENQGNITGGGVLNSDYTLGQVAQKLGISPDVLKKIPGLSQLFGGTTSTGEYSFPFGKVLGGLLESYGQKQY